MAHKFCRLAKAAILSALITACSEAPAPPAAPEPKVEGDSVMFPPGSPTPAGLASRAVSSQAAPATRLNGRLAWDEDRTVRIYTPFGGRVTRILAQPGQPVKQGQALAIISSPEFGQAQAEARRAEGDHALAEKNLTRMKELESHGVAARKELQSAEADYARASAELQRTRARMQAYAASGAQVDQTYTLTSPVSGVVVEKNINPGQELRSDQILANAPALFVVTNPDFLWVWLDATEQDLPALKIDKLVTVRSPAYREADFVARIVSVSDFFDPATRTIKVRATLPNAHRKLKAEMFVTAAIESEQVSVLQVPTKAVFFQGGKHFLFIDEGNGKFTRREVRTGDDSLEHVAIRDGIREGEKVVIEGALMLQQTLQPRRVQK